MLITLVCAMVGENEKAFSIEIEARKYVDTLKKAIKASKPNRVTGDAKEMKLYLAKRNGLWVKEVGLDELTKNDLHTSFVKMNPVRVLDHIDHGFADEDMQENGNIHVLVEMPMSEAEIAEHDEHAASELRAHLIPKKRKQRWDILNPIVIQDATKYGRKKQKGGTANSLVTKAMTTAMMWKMCFPIELYQQRVQEVPPETLTSIANALKIKTEVYGTIIGDDTQRFLFIETIVTHVVHLFHADPTPVRIFMDEDLNGDYVKAHIHFDLMLKRGNKRICIMQAKNDDFEQGMSQNIVGMEVAAEVDSVSTVYGIVTNYLSWVFLERSDDSVKKDTDTLTFEYDYATKGSLKRIAGKIYSLLMQ